MNVTQLSNPTIKQYNMIKSHFGELVNDYHFLLSHETWEPKRIHFLSDINICRFNQIVVSALNGYSNPDCTIIEVDFADFMTIISKQFKVFTAEEEKAWRNDLSNKTAFNLLNRT